MSGGQFDIWSIAGLLFVAGIAYWGFRLLKNRLDDQRYREHMAELEFEASLLGGVESPASIASNDAVFLQQQVQTASDISNPTVPTHPLSAQPNPHLTDPTPPSADVLAAALIQKLQHAGILSSIEGYSELHGNAKGVATVRLRSGKVALIVPHMESEAFLRKNSRRADMIIMVGSNGNGFVVTPVEKLISDNVALM